MINATLKVIANLFADQNLSEEDEIELFNETALMTLARATNADSNIHPIEVKLVQEKIKEVTGQDISTKDVRVAANSHLFEKTTLENWLIRIHTNLSTHQKVAILVALADVIRADEKVTQREVTFFNMVSAALRLSPSDILGITS